ncbi:MAG: hypothetical protein MI919_10895, partial [Holophagales bacterium]|nr:hypothetical protein [Holophagales bacterium]
TLTIDNAASPLAATALDFTDTLPAGVVVASPPNASTTCTSGTITAAAGSGTISYTDGTGTVAAAASCTLSVDVTSAVDGVYVNTSGDLTSSSGNSGPASDTLTVSPAPVPGFAKVFAPDSIPQGGVSTLTFTIDNSGALLAATALDFTDPLPAGVVVASPANEVSTCTGGTITAVPGSGTISYTGGTVAAGGICTVSVDVTSAVAMLYTNTTGDLTSSLGNSGPASDTLAVTPAPVPGFAKAFAPATIVAGGVSTLTFTIDNSGALVDATSLDFTDPLPAGVVVASPANDVSICTGGTVSAVSGTGTIGYTGGTVTASGTCTISVDVTSAADGAYVNTTGDLTSSLGNSGTATDTLTVSPAPPPGFTKAFAPPSIGVGGVSTLTLTIDNSTALVDATSLDFTDPLPAGVVVASPENAVSTCTGGTVTAVSGTGTISYTGGTVAAGTSCTISADVTSAADGVYVNTTGDLTSSAGNSGPATATLTVAEALGLAKAFETNPAVAGGTIDVVYTLTNNSGTTDATGIGCTDDLGAAVPGLEALGLPVSDVCGIGSTVAGTSVITFSGGTLPPGDSCT